jgi:ABC-2 type transport system permease protein
MRVDKLSGIFKYEARRLLLSPVYLGLLLINLLYAWFVLSTETILGVGYTAPFSGWSLGAYWASVLPIAMLAVLFLLTNYFSPQAKRIETLTDNTPVNQAHYWVIRMAAVALCFGVMAFLLGAFPVTFFALIFGRSVLAALAVTAVLTVLPCFIFTVGLGYGLARIHWKLLYAAMVVVLLVGLGPLANALDFFGGGYYTSMPLALPVGADGEPAFTPGAAFMSARGLYLAAGAALLGSSLKRVKRKSGRGHRGRTNGSNGE